MYKVIWPRVNEADSYNLYMSILPGSSYEFVENITQEQNTTKPEYLHPRYEFSIDMTPLNLSLEETGAEVSITWDSPINGVPYTFKVLPNFIETPPTQDSVWFSDSIPEGADWEENANIYTDISRRITGECSIKVVGGNKYDSHRFSSATTPMPKGYIVVWVYIDSNHAPDSIWIELFDGQSWEHRIYWGKDVCPYGVNGSPSLFIGGPLPSLNCWVPLVFHTDALDIDNIYGMGFGLNHEEDEVHLYIDSAASSNYKIIPTRQPHYPVRHYRVSRDNKLILKTQGNSATDQLTPYHETFLANISINRGEPTNTGEAVDISWSLPLQNEDEYLYSLSSESISAVTSSAISDTILTQEDYAYIKIYHSTDKETIGAGGNLVYNGPGPLFSHTGLTLYTPQWYRIELYDINDELVNYTIESLKTLGSSQLDYFILDYSTLL